MAAAAQTGCELRAASERSVSMVGVSDRSAEVNLKGLVACSWSGLNAVMRLSAAPAANDSSFALKFVVVDGDTLILNTALVFSVRIILRRLAKAMRISNHAGVKELHTLSLFFPEFCKWIGICALHVGAYYSLHVCLTLAVTDSEVSVFQRRFDFFNCLLSIGNV